MAARAVTHLTRAERQARGKAARAEVPRRRTPSTSRLPPARTRSGCSRSRQHARPRARPDPLRADAVSPFAFYRGAALHHGRRPRRRRRAPGSTSQICGDAHLSQLRRVRVARAPHVFDINDFDETLPGPWEWDVKRLAASFEIAGREQRLLGAGSGRDGVLAAVARLPRRDARVRRRCATWTSGTRTSTSSELLAQSRGAGRTPAGASGPDEPSPRRGRSDSMQAFAKLTAIVDGEPRIVADPPLIVPSRTCSRAGAARALDARCGELIRALPRTLQTDRRRPARAVPLRRHGPQGRRRRQRRHPLLDRAAARPRRERPAVPAGQGGAAVGARAYVGTSRYANQASGSSPASG